MGCTAPPIAIFLWAVGTRGGAYHAKRTYRLILR